MNYVLKRIDDLNEVLQVWPLIKDRLLRAMANSNEGSSLDDVIIGIVERTMQLWIIYDDEKILNVFVTEFNNEEPSNVLNFYLLEAESLATVNADTIGQVLEWAKENGASRAELLARPGWEKVMKNYGFSKTYVLMSKEI